MCFCLVASEGTGAAQGLVGAKDICSRGYEIPKVIGRNDAERWENLAKIGPKLIGMTKTQLEAAIGVGDFNPKKGELAYALTEVNSSREGYAATIAIMSLKNGKVVRFCVYSTNWRVCKMNCVKRSGQ